MSFSFAIGVYLSMGAISRLLALSLSVCLDRMAIVVDTNNDEDRLVTMVRIRMLVSLAAKQHRHHWAHIHDFIWCVRGPCQGPGMRAAYSMNAVESR